MALEATLQLARGTVEQEDVPMSGACLFHAIIQEQGGAEAQELRQRVVAHVALLWERDGGGGGGEVDLRAVLGWNELDPQDSISLADQVRRRSGGVLVQDLAGYCSFMSGQSAYGDTLEAAVAARLEGLELTIYVIDDRDQTKLRAVATGLGLVGGVKRKVLLLNQYSSGSCHYNILRDH